MDSGLGGAFGATVLHSEYAMPEWIPVLLDDPFEDWRRCKPCGLQAEHLGSMFDSVSTTRYIIVDPRATKGSKNLAAVVEGGKQEIYCSLQP